MRPETSMAWILVGLGLLTIGMFLAIFQVTEYSKLAGFLAAVGFVYFIIGMVLAIMNDRHMAERMRANRE
jgi:amino acid transporter